MSATSANTLREGKKDLGSLRERKKEQTRVDLIQATVKLFHERGYEATTVDDICEAANYSRSTFFRYFGCKEDVVFVFAELGGVFLSYLEALLVADPDGNPWRMAREAMVREALEYFSYTGELEADCVALWFREPALQRRYMDITMQVELQLEDFFAQAWGVDAATNIECRLTAMAITSIARAIMQTHATGQGDLKERAETIRRAFDFYEKGEFGTRRMGSAKQRTPTGATRKRR